MSFVSSNGIANNEKAAARLSLRLLNVLGVCMPYCFVNTTLLFPS